MTCPTQLNSSKHLQIKLVGGRSVDGRPGESNVVSFAKQNKSILVQKYQVYKVSSTWQARCGLRIGPPPREPMCLETATRSYTSAAQSFAHGESFKNSGELRSEHCKRSISINGGAFCMSWTGAGFTVDLFAADAYQCQTSTQMKARVCQAATLEQTMHKRWCARRVSLLAKTMDKAWSEHREATKNEKKPNSRKLCVEIKAVYSKSRHIAISSQHL